MAAGGHYGNKSPKLVKHYAEDLGFEYMSASNKEEFHSVVERFTDPKLGDKSMVLEVFTDYHDEGESIEDIRRILSTKHTLKRKISKLVDSLME